jgi:hypothetical protein
MGGMDIMDKHGTDERASEDKIGRSALYLPNQTYVAQSSPLHRERHSSTPSAST